MIENIFMLIFGIGVISLIMSVYEGWENLTSLVLSFVSITFLASAWAGTTYLIIPGIDDTFSETGIGFICMGLIIVNAIGAIISIMNVNTELKGSKH